MKNSRRLIFLGLVWVICCSGCNDSRYLSEKLLFQTERQVAELIKKRAGTLQDGDYDAIIASYKKVAEQFPLELVTAQIHFIIAQVYQARKNPDAAIQELKTVIQNFSSQSQLAATAQLSIGKIYEAQGKYQQALQEYEKIKDLYPLTQLGLEVPLFLTQYYDKAKNTEKEERAYKGAVRHYKKLIDDYSGTSQESVFQEYLVRTYLQGNEVNKAMGVLDDVTEKYKDTPVALRALVGKAEIYVNKLKDIPKAIAIYEDFINKYPKSTFVKELKLRIADLYFSDNQVKESQVLFTTLLKEYPDDKSVGIRGHFGLAACYMRQGMSDYALHEYDVIKDSYPNNAAALAVPFLRYRYYTYLKDTVNADVALVKAIGEYENTFQTSANQEKLMAARFLLVCYAAKKEWDKSLKLLRTLSREFPNDPGFLLSIATLYSKVMDQPDAAMKVYDEIAEKFPANKKLLEVVDNQVSLLKNAQTGKKTDH